MSRAFTVSSISIALGLMMLALFGGRAGILAAGAGMALGTIATIPDRRHGDYDLFGMAVLGGAFLVALSSAVLRPTFHEPGEVCSQGCGELR